MLKVIFNKMVGVFVLLLFGILCELFDRLINRHAIIKKNYALLCNSWYYIFEKITNIKIYV